MVRVLLGCAQVPGARGIAYRAVDIDSGAYRATTSASRSATGNSTIPQLFLGGDLVDGASETFAAYQRGQLYDLLRQHGVAFAAAVGDELHSLLPGWVQRGYALDRPVLTIQRNPVLG